MSDKPDLWVGADGRVTDLTAEYGGERVSEKRVFEGVAFICGQEFELRDGIWSEHILTSDCADLDGKRLRITVEVLDEDNTPTAPRGV